MWRSIFAGDISPASPAASYPLSVDGEEIRGGVTPNVASWKHPEEVEMAEAKRVPVPKEVRDFMDNNGRTFMLTLRKDGSPTGHPMGGFWGGGLYLNMYRDSVKNKNLLRDPSICCITTTPSDAKDFKAIVYRGSARAVPVEETSGEAAPAGLRRARAPLEQNNARPKPKEAPPDDPVEAQRRLDAVKEKVKAGLRLVYEVVPEQTGMLDKLRGA